MCAVIAYLCAEVHLALEMEQGVQWLLWHLGFWEIGREEGRGAEMGEPGRVRIEGRRPPRGQKLGGTKSKQPPILKRQQEGVWWQRKMP